MSHADSPLGGLNRRKLIRECALKDPSMTWDSIAKRYGVSGAAITQFRKRNAEEIAAVAKAADDEFAGILIAQKEFRLRAYQEIYETAMTPQPKVAANGNVAMRIDPETKQVVQVMEVQLGEARQALKQAAEELGQLANRITMTGDLNTTTTYRIVNVTDDDLT